MLASNAFVWQVIHISKKGGCTEGRRGRETEEGRVAAFRTTDTPRGFILSPKIQPNASSPGEKPRRVRASTEATTGIWGRTGPCTLDLSVFFLSEAPGCARLARCENLTTGQALKNGDSATRARVPVSSVRSCCAPARPPLQDRTAEDETGNFWRRSCHQSVFREPAWRVQPSPSSTRITFFFFSFTPLKGRRNGDFSWLSLFPLLSNGYSLQGRPLHRDAP